MVVLTVQKSPLSGGKGKAGVQVTGYRHKQQSGSLLDIFCPVSRNLTCLLAGYPQFC